MTDTYEKVSNTLVRKTSPQPNMVEVLDINIVLNEIKMIEEEILKFQAKLAEKQQIVLSAKGVGVEAKVAEINEIIK